MAVRPNILLLMSDQHRADIVGYAGDPVVHTPNIDRLAAQGVSFDRAYCQGPLCMPSRASVITERYVRDHGVFENSSEVPAGMPTFLHRLREAGYHTAEIGKMHLWAHGLTQAGHTRDMNWRLEQLGFAEAIETVGKLATVRHDSYYTDYLRERGLLDTYRKFIAGHRHAMRARGGPPSWTAEPVPLEIRDYADVWHGMRTARWIDEYDRAQPFFLWVGFPGPHDPWDAPVAAVERYRAADIPMPRSTELPELPGTGPLQIFLRAMMTYSDSDTMTTDAIAKMRRAYYANVTLIDEAVGAIVAALERRSMLDHTWIIYTTDHGEMMGEHRMLAKMVFYEPSVRVPLVLRPPGGVAPRTISERAQLLDVAATMRGIADAPALENSEGQSMLAAIRGEHEYAPRRALPTENFGFAAFIRDRHKLVVYEDTLEPVQLFDLAEDPAEDRNRVKDPDYASVVDEMMEADVRPFFATHPLRPHADIVNRLAARFRSS
jgi:arylsulfatase